MTAMGELPSGTVTFLFTDVEGSTKLLHELGPERYAQALAEHRRVLREAFEHHGGVEVDTQGDAFFVAFPTAPGALEAAREAQGTLSIPVRMGVHTGTPLLTVEGYIGPDVHRAARVAAAGHGGQVLVSSATTGLLPASDSLLLDLGEHRLKDLSAPERIYQLGKKDFPPLKTLYRTNLPVPATPFLGRERELADIRTLVERDDVRVLTLTGPGGTGKTRLSLQAAGDAADRFHDGVFWVPLAPLRDADLVLEQAAQALGATDGLAEHVGDKRLLLVLDNFEHVIEAANGLPSLLEASPNLKLLVTSREVLRIPGEQAYPVPPLEPHEGTELFVARAQAANPGFSPTPVLADLCARLDNLPLALELAAARVRLLSPEQLLERLSTRLDLLKAGRGVDPRQQTLRATIEWSYELLDPDEQRLFARLSIFRGGCTLEAAEAVCDADIDVMQSLVDKSLIRHNEGRFWMLETIREYAFERLEFGEAEEVRQQHANYFLAFVEDASPMLLAEGLRSGRRWHDRVEAEHDNLRAAIERFEATDDAERALRMTAGLADYWRVRGPIREARARLERALAAHPQPTAVRARALNGAAELALVTGDRLEATRLAEEALTLHRKVGDRWGEAAALQKLGVIAVVTRDFVRARELLEESIRDFLEAGDEDYALWTRRTLGWTYHDAGDLDRARALHEGTLDRARARGNDQLAAALLGSLATIAVDQGRVEDALALARESVPIWQKEGDRTESALELSRVARTLAHAGQVEPAARLLACAERAIAEMGGAEGWIVEINDETRARLESQLDPDSVMALSAEGRRLEIDEGLALALENVS